MLQTPHEPRRRRPLLAETWIEEGSRRRHSPYFGLPAKYAGTATYQGYRLGPGTDLQSAGLANADLRWTNFAHANLSGADLSGAVLWGSTLTQADLSSADLSHADLTGVDLVGANLADCQLEGTIFAGARYSNATTRFPKGFDPETEGMLCEGSDALLAG